MILKSILCSVSVISDIMSTTYSELEALGLIAINWRPVYTNILEREMLYEQS